MHECYNRVPFTRMSSLTIFLGLLAVSILPVLGIHPIIQHYVKPKTVKLCGDPVLYCEVQSSPDAKVWWTLNGTVVTTDGPNTTVLRDLSNSNGTVSVWKLQISCAQFSQSGNYTCNVKTTDSSIHYSKSLYLHISEPLTIEYKQWVKGELGDKVILNCTIVGRPLPASIQWNKNGTFVESSDNINVSQRVVGTSEITSSLEILNLTSADLGPYTCLASSSVDFITRDITVVNKGLAPPTDVYVRPTSPDSVAVKWKSVASEGGIRIDFHRILVTSEADGQSTTDVTNVTFWTSTSIPPHHQFNLLDLETDRLYKFSISACNNHIGCGEVSETVTVVLHRYASIPLNVTVTCHYDNISMGSLLEATWEVPRHPNGQIIEYRVLVVGLARYLNSLGSYTTDELAPRVATSTDTIVKVPVDPNTNYTVQVCAVTAVGCGELSDVSFETTCSTPPSVPKSLPDFALRNLDDAEDPLRLKLNLQRINQRHGKIECYRIVLYKMKSGKQAMPPTNEINISSYSLVHRDGEFGAYIAEAFDGDKFEAEIILGDDSQSHCVENNYYHHRVNNNNHFRDRRHYRQRRSVGNPLSSSNSVEFVGTDSDVGGSGDVGAVGGGDVEVEMVQDGKLAPDTFYSGFVEVRVLGKDEMILAKRSSWFHPIRTGSIKYDNIQATALGVICGLLIVIIILTVALCALSKRNNYDYHHENNSRGGFMGFIATIFRGGTIRRNGLMGTPVLPLPDTKPLKPENLVTAYTERHKDSDLLFQREFESLPEQFRDRTTRSSDMLENFFKNRYPDIKAYDQTRVKLSTVDGVTGSDYINANFVAGYKDRKKFICAQGPLDKTVNDFWRMVWEQHVEIIVMVTGLEENGKMKCAKYWPEQNEKKYGDITVTTGECQLFADYLVRSFTVSQRKDSEANSVSSQESRQVLQFHYLMWKDFLAPEYPGGILKFIMRINEKLDPEKGPLLVHCSAGVGRTGTLVVIDSLLQQMREEGQIEIFNFVVNLRRQRNFLVQSLKQYIFIYRSLMEFAQFGDTEIEAKDLKEMWKQLQKNSDKKSLLKQEYEKLSQVIEDPKTTDIATSEVNLAKNRNEAIVPYDRNRVIVTPVPSREHSTYINASFLQGYDQSMVYIITQDPMESTASEFWRMIHEQCVSAIVTLDRDLDYNFMPETEADFDHINVKMVSTITTATPTPTEGEEEESKEDNEEDNKMKSSGEENNSSWRRREVQVTNTRSSKAHNVVCLQYLDWPKASTRGSTSGSSGGGSTTNDDNDVPTNTSSFIDFLKTIHGIEGWDADSPVVVHCSTGSDRSPTLVACSTVVSRLDVEKRIDVFQTVRNMRSQRCGLFQKFAHYQCCYQVALSYLDTLSIAD